MDNTKAITSNGFKIRWISCACFEIELPNGRRIMTDPYITDSPFSTIDVNDIEGADYILLSHTHFDHVTDVGKLAEKFDSKVLVGSLSAYDLASHYDMNPNNIYAVSNGDVFEFDDCKIEVFFGKHINLPFSINEVGPVMAEDQGYKNMEKVNSNGSLEFMNFLITLENNLTIFVWGGKVTDEQYHRFKLIKPNIALMQIPGNSKDDLSKFIGHINPQIVIPHHHDSLRLPGPLGIIDVDQYLSDLTEKMKKDAPNTLLLNSECGQWYQTAMNISAL